MIPDDPCTYVRLRREVVRIYGLKYRQGFTAFVSSNLTLSANNVQVEHTGLSLPPAARFRSTAPTSNLG